MKHAWLVLLIASVSFAAPTKKRTVVLVLDRAALLIEAEKTAALAVMGALAPDDQIEIIAFDKDASTVVPLQRPSKRVAKAIAEIRSGNGRSNYPALKLALDGLKHAHIIFVTDGDAPSDGVAKLLDDVTTRDITISAVGVQGADRNFLQQISEAGSGRLYMVDDIKALPKIFVKELAQ